MLNVGGGELLVIALVALVALGPEQLPAVMRKLGALTSQLRSLSSDLKDEFLSGVDEPSQDRPPSRRPVAKFDPNEPVVPRGYAQRRALEDAAEASSADEATAAAERSDDPAPPVAGAPDEATDSGRAS